MKHAFYDVKEKKKVEVEVTEKFKTKNNRYALKAQTSDGRNLTAFVGKDKWDEVQL